MTDPSHGDPATSPGTDTLAAAREHARRQAAEHDRLTITMPPQSATDLPEGIDASQVIWHEVIPPRGYASQRLPRGAHLRIDDTDGDGCVAVVVHRADQPAERLNVADTVKVQWQAYPAEGTLLLSGMGRVLASIVEDSSGRHDALCGCTNQGSVEGSGAWTPAPSTRDLLCLGLVKQGLERRDLPPNLNLFAAVRVLEDGTLVLDPTPAPGAHVTLRAEMPLIVTLANAPHPLDDRPEPSVTSVRCTAWRTPEHGPSTEDPLRTATPERERAFLNTDAELALAQR